MGGKRKKGDRRRGGRGEIGGEEEQKEIGREEEEWR